LVLGYNYLRGIGDDVDLTPDSGGGGGGGAGVGNGSGSDPISVRLDQPFTVGDARITVLEGSYSRGTNEFLMPSAGHVYVAFEVRIEAVSGDVFASVGDWTAATDDGRQGDYAIAGNDDWDPELGFDDIDQGNEVQGWIVFEVPEPDTGVVLTYEESIFSSGPDAVLRLACCD
jgi:hypothetical protein